MYTYSGKLNYGDYAVNECFTLVFPAGFALNDPVSGYWQWTNAINGATNVNNTVYASINSVTKTSTQYRIHFDFPWYQFDAVVGKNFDTLDVTMTDNSKPGDKLPTISMTLALQYSDDAKVPSWMVYTGKLTWENYLKNEMITLVLPSAFLPGAPVGLYYQWTESGSGQKKLNHFVSSRLSWVATPADTWQFSDGYYTFQITFKNSGQDVHFEMLTPNGEKATSDLKQTDFRSAGTKKALIVRYNTGDIGKGIFQIKDMLVNYLGFAQGDIEMLYFDIDPEDSTQPKKCTKGQRPPTAANFKKSFANLLSSAVAGDVRFVYVDTHGAPYPASDDEGEKDKKDETWTMAQNDAGTLKQSVTDNEVAEIIKAGLKSDVNLTIVTSSCFGGGMLDTHKGVGGILLSGCHESQFNVKKSELNYLDPFTFALIAMVKKQAKNKKNGAIPSYSVLYAEAKQFIKLLIHERPININGKYRGPSEVETKPTPCNGTVSSNQDPQMAFNTWYLDPDTEKFCCPFIAPNCKTITADWTATVYPEDEYANTHDEL